MHTRPRTTGASDCNADAFVLRFHVDHYRSAAFLTAVVDACCSMSHAHGQVESRHMLGDASKNALAMQFAAEDETVDTYTVPAMSTAQSLQGLY